MSLAVPNELNKADLSLNSEVSFNDVRLPHALTSSTQRLGIDIDPNSEEVEPLIAQLNQRGLKSIAENEYNQALVFFQEAQNLLQLVAGCGKSIDRQLILTILSNEAYVFHEEGKLDLAKRYIEAVIYNINVYLEHSMQVTFSMQLQLFLEGGKTQQDVQAFLQQHWVTINTIITRIYQLSVAQLQYSALLAENYEHVAAAALAEKSIDSMATHLRYSRIYKYRFPSKNALFGEVQIQQLILDQQQLNLIDIEELSKEIEAGIQKIEAIESDSAQESGENIPKIGSIDFMRLKPQAYERIDPSEITSKVEKDTSPQRLLFKYFHLACGYLLMGSSKMKEYNEMQFLIGTTSDYEQERRVQLREAELHYLLSLKILLQSLRGRVPILTEFIEAYRSRFSQEYRIRIIQAAEQKQSQHLKGLAKLSNFSDNDHDISDIKVSQKLVPPSVDPFIMDLSSADSIDLQSNASMVDVLREADSGPKSEQDEELYFQFMPKKTNSNNPLFQATANLGELRKETGLKSSTKVRTFEVSLEVTVQDSSKKQGIRQQITNNDSKNKYFTPRNKDTSKQKGKSKSKGKYLSPRIQIHSASAQSIGGKSKSKCKRSKSKNPEKVVDRLFTFNSKPTYKKESKMGSEKVAKFNKVKSPPPKPRTGKQLANPPKIIKLKSNSKSKSKPKSIKPIKSKSKSVHKNPVDKKSDSRFQNIYLVRNK